MIKLSLLIPFDRHVAIYSLSGLSAKRYTGDTERRAGSAPFFCFIAGFFRVSRDDIRSVCKQHMHVREGGSEGGRRICGEEVARHLSAKERCGGGRCLALAYRQGRKGTRRLMAAADILGAELDILPGRGGRRKMLQVATDERAFLVLLPIPSPVHLPLVAMTHVLRPRYLLQRVRVYLYLPVSVRD